jgi:hypothetical protein
VKRRLFLLSLPLAAADTRQSIRGKLVNASEPFLLTEDGRRIAVDGDEEVRLVLRDKRLSGADFEVMGELLPEQRFTAAPIHTRPLFVHKEGKRFHVTYWCDVCAIRTNSPGICWCCREDTALDLREH